MTRPLVTTDEASRHPFLATLPPHVRSGAKRQLARSKWYVSRQDMRGFVSSYFACLAAVAAFIA